MPAELYTPVYLNQDEIQNLSSILIDGYFESITSSKLAITLLQEDINIIIKANAPMTIKTPKVIRMIIQS